MSVYFTLDLLDARPLISRRAQDQKSYFPHLVSQRYHIKSNLTVISVNFLIYKILQREYNLCWKTYQMKNIKQILRPGRGAVNICFSRRFPRKSTSNSSAVCKAARDATPAMINWMKSIFFNNLAGPAAIFTVPSIIDTELKSRGIGKEKLNAKVKHI